MDNKDEEKIGYGNPPQHSRFKKGQTGNKSGRPKGSKNVLKILDKLLEQKVLTTQEGKQIKITKKTAILLQAVNSAVRGEIKSLQVLLPHMIASDAKNEIAQIKPIGAEDQAIIDRFLQNNKQDKNNE